MGKISCLKVGCGDATAIRTDTATFLVDTYQINEHSSLLPSNKKIRGVFITHQHSDHYSGLQYLWDNGYSIDCLIYSPYERRRGDTSVTLDEWNEFNDLKDKFKGKGTKLFSPHRQDSWDKPYWETNGAKFWLIGPDKGTAATDTREIHDACLVIKADLGKRKILFAGDASDKNLQFIEENTKNFCDDILHASHHGSINGAYLPFIKKCSAKYTLISTKSGVYESVPDSTALRRYNDNTENKVYRTDNDGTITWTF
ncbi:MAG: MBL fold metallo-hydrolase [Desulfobulbus sp.]|nr:MBL fold metallo-hydrolase [Desulfobulbus sp.]